MSAVLPPPINVATPPLDATAATITNGTPTNSTPSTPPDRVASAMERLASSRQQLRAAMMPAPPKPHAHLLGDGIGAWASHLVDRVKSTPGATVFVEAIEIWWEQHPLHTAGRIVAEAARKFAVPVAERNPLALVFGAVFFGALLALIRPWRWMLRPALFAGLLPALVASAVRELPLDSLRRMFPTARTPKTSRPSDSASTGSVSSVTAL